jgi:hypothetical protein
MGNKWLQHLAQFRRANNGIPPQEMMKAARRSYQNGGANGNGNSGNSGNGPMPVMSPTMAQAMKLKGGAVVPYERAVTESSPSKVGGRRRTRRQSRKSRRTRRR